MLQPFDPLDFLGLAGRLASPTAGEAELRTAVNRTYYALFLTARDRIGITGTSHVHRRVIAEVQNRTNKGTADQLKALRRLRTTADYEMLPSDPSMRNWQANFSRAHQIASHLLPLIRAI
jgi:hypothetical protein